MKQARDSALGLATAQARLQTAQGNLVGATKSLQTALAGVNEQTVQSINAQTQLANVQNRLARESRRGGFSLIGAQAREAGESIQQAGFAFQQFITEPLTGLAERSVRSAIDIDRNVNALKALTGSAEAAEKRFQALFNLAQATPGLTTSAAAALDAQLRLARVGEQTIDRFLKTVGRLNAVQSIGDPQDFANNLRPLIDQGFDRADLKQVVNRNPIAGELIKNLFGVDNPTNAEAIRAATQRLGITTAEQFFAAFARAGENSDRLKNVTESLAVQLEKAQDQLAVALRPLGVDLLNILIPAVQAAVPVVQTLAQAFNSLPEPIKLTAIAVAGLVAALGPGLNLFGGAIQALQVIQITRLAQGLQTANAAATEAAAGVSLFAGSLARLRAAFAATSAFLLTTPAGWAVLAAGTLAAVAAYAAFNDEQQEAIEKADALKLGDIAKQFENVAFASNYHKPISSPVHRRT